MKHRKTLNHGCKKIPIQMGLSRKSKYVGLHNCKVCGVGNAGQLQNQLDPGVQRMPLGLAFLPFWPVLSSLLASCRQDLSTRWQRWSRIEYLGFQPSF